jgi:hypothetical protein
MSNRTVLTKYRTQADEMDMNADISACLARREKNTEYE